MSRLDAISRDRITRAARDLATRGVLESLWSLGAFDLADAGGNKIKCSPACLQELSCDEASPCETETPRRGSCDLRMFPPPALGKPCPMPRSRPGGAPFVSILAKDKRRLA
jgi:hypothetical protein